MKPITTKMLMRGVWEGMPQAVFIYTPLCGTCTAARRMLEVVEHMLPEGIISEMNIHDIPELVQQFQISSVQQSCCLMDNMMSPKWSIG